MNASRIAAGIALAAAGCMDADDGDVRAIESHVRAPTGYHVVKLTGLGGSTSNGNSINNLVWATGISTRADAAIHATAWIGGVPIDLGTLGAPGSNSGVIWPVKNVRGIVSGITEVAGDDPNHESWSCAAFLPKTPGHVCRGFVWEAGAMRALPTLGGTHGFATGTNNRRQTVGWAETAERDPTCNQVDQFLGFKAVVWGPGADDLRVLPPLAGDSASAATIVNDRGDVAGISGDCSNSVGGTSARHAVLWKPDGTTIDLGNLGNTIAWTTPMAMNQSGVIVGFANAPGTEPPTRFNYRPFVWTVHDGMRDLGVLPNHTRGQALGINAAGRAVGFTRSTTEIHGVIWDHGTVTDLNALIVSGSRDTIRFAGDIDDLGIITGTSVDASGAQSTFLAIPVAF